MNYLKKIISNKCFYKIFIAAFCGITIIFLSFFTMHTYCGWGDYTIVDAPWRPAGGVGIGVPLLDAIETEYGTDAKNAYVEGSKTGDWYQYRTITGFWQPVKYDPKIKAHAIPGIADPLYFLHNGVTEDEDFIYTMLGKYGTAADWIEICQQYNVQAFTTTGGNSDVEALLFGKMPMTYTKITKQQYLANHSAASMTATASSLDLEGLKTYSGNTTEFNAYYYYTNYADLQSALGADGAKLLAHYNQYGKAEGRVANKSIK